MGFDPEDQEIIRLLTKIKDAEGEYPEQMLVARRHSFLKRMGEISLGVLPDMGTENAPRGIKPSSVSPATSTLLETALVIAIIAEVGTVAYFYRDQLADFFHRTGIEPRVQDVTPPPVVPTFLTIQEIVPSAALTATLPSATIWSPPSPTGVVVTPTSTPIPGVVNNSSLNTTSTISSGEPNLVNSTPGPNDSIGDNGNNGNHYGQTPKPERTKENGNNPPPKENEDKTPKENIDRPPKDNEAQPPKDSNEKPPKDNKDKSPKK